MGTTTVSVILMDVKNGEIVSSKMIAHGAFLKRHILEARIQDAEKLVEIIQKTVVELSKEYGIPVGIGLTGQMHGMVICK